MTISDEAAAMRQEAIAVAGVALDPHRAVALAGELVARHLRLVHGDDRLAPPRPILAVGGIAGRRPRIARPAEPT